MKAAVRSPALDYGIPFIHSAEKLQEGQKQLMEEADQASLVLIRDAVGVDQLKIVARCGSLLIA